MTSPNLSGRAILILAVLCLFAGAFLVLPLLATREVQAPGKAPAPTFAAPPAGLTIHPQGELAPMPPNAVSPPYLVDYGDGKGPQVERGVLRFGDAQTSGGVERR